jgi:membrane dipeptidase
MSVSAAELHRDAVFIDLHCDLLLTTTLTGWDWGKRHRPNPFPGAPLMGHVDIPRLRDGGVDALGLGLVTLPGQGPRALRRQLDLMDERIARHPDHLALATTAEEITACKSEGRIACFPGLEGVHCLKGQLDLVPELAARGLAYAGLVHFHRNWAAAPMVGWGADPDRPLTPAGRALVASLRAQRILVDVAHLNQAGLVEVCESSDVPVICSHTACNAVHQSPRGLDTLALEAIASTGGVIGVIFVSFFLGRGGLDQVVRHLRHIKDTVGADHCAIGTDWEGFALYPEALNSAEKLPALTDALVADGWTGAEIRKAYGENFLRVLDRVRG